MVHFFIHKQFVYVSILSAITYTIPGSFYKPGLFKVTDISVYCLIRAVYQISLIVINQFPFCFWKFIKNLTINLNICSTGICQKITARHIRQDINIRDIYPDTNICDF